MAPVDLSFSQRKVCWLLIISVLLLTFAGGAVQFLRYGLAHEYLWGMLPLFDLSADSGLPTWYASVTLLLCSVLLMVIARAKRREQDRFALHWRVLSLIFLLLSLDEMARLHEILGDIVRDQITGDMHGLLRYTWVIGGMVFVLIFVIAYIKFLLHLPVKSMVLFTLAGAVFVGGALGMEMLNGRYNDLYGTQNLTYQMMTTLEEFLEMSGVAIFIYALMSYLASSVNGVRIQIKE